MKNERLDLYLMEIGKEEIGDMFNDSIVTYKQDVNQDVESGDWLEKGTSYIWKIGVLAVVDGNKRDWANLFIGHQRKPFAPFEYIGRLRWRDGENDDPGRSLARYVKCAQLADIVFEE